MITLLFAAAAIALALPVMVIGACVDRHYFLDCNRKATGFAIAGFTIGGCIFLLGYLAGGVA